MARSAPPPNGESPRPAPRLVVATWNPGKVREIAAALEAVGIVGEGLEALATSGAIPSVDRDEVGGGGGCGAVREGASLEPVEETGSTFEENARIKAEAYSRLTALPVVADDSGLEVDALGGGPGVHSARYGGEGLDDADRVRLLLREIESVPDERRGARFRCVLALARGGRTLATFAGVVEGRIARAPRGSNGFGYDPVFFHEGAGCTFAELTREQKQRLSHRGQAIAALIEAVRAGAVEIGSAGSRGG